MERVGIRGVEAVVGRGHRVDRAREQRMRARILDPFTVEIATAAVDERRAVLVPGHHRHGLSPVQEVGFYKYCRSAPDGRQLAPIGVVRLVRGRRAAATFVATCSGEVAPNSTVATSGWPRANATASAAGVVSRRRASSDERARSPSTASAVHRLVELAGGAASIRVVVVLAGQHSARQRVRRRRRARRRRAAPPSCLRPRPSRGGRGCRAAARRTVEEHRGGRRHATRRAAAAPASSRSPMRGRGPS